VSRPKSKEAKRLRQAQLSRYIDSELDEALRVRAAAEDVDMVVILERALRAELSRPVAVANALRVHLEITGVDEGDFVLLAIRHELVAQRAAGLGLISGCIPPGGEGLAL
jgi:plasmid stability protein